MCLCFACFFLAFVSFVALHRRGSRTARRLWLLCLASFLLSFCMLLLALAVASGPLLRAPASGALHAATHLELALKLVGADGAPAWLADGCCRRAISSWTQPELSELQWPALEDAAREQAEERRKLAEAHGGGAALEAALEVTHAHALPCAGELWLVPGAAALPRAAPHGACLERSALGDELLVIDDDGATAIGSGWRSNDELLLSEGWADGNLSCDAFEIHESVLSNAASSVHSGGNAASDALAAQRASVVAGLARFRYLAEPAQSAGPLFAGGYVSDSLGRYLQALALTETELSAEASPAEVNACVLSIGEGVCLSVAHERRTGEVLVAACDELLEDFPTSAEEDEATLAGLDEEHGPDRLRQALRSRLSRKRCLADVRARAAAWVERPTAAGGTLRRPWRVHVRTSG